MHPYEMIRTALSSGQTALSEYQSKQFLAQFGVPVAQEVLALDLAEAVTAAESLGYPVALKACGAQLLHKSGLGSVALHLTDQDQVRDAYSRLIDAADSALEGILVQEMIYGVRELVVGLTRDLQFGPCVMLGVGGVMTEIFKDIVFRMAPVDQGEVADMISQLRGKEMLGNFRGENPVDRDAIYRCLIGLGKIGMRFTQVAEIDINPLIISSDGKITAVDALMILKEAE